MSEKGNDDSIVVPKPMDLRRSAPTVNQTISEQKTTRTPLPSTFVSSEIQSTEKTCNVGTGNTRTENECEKNCKRGLSYTDVARHPLKRRRMEFLSQMGAVPSTSDCTNRPNKIEQTNSKLIIQEKMLQTSLSDKTLSLSWTEGYSEQKTHDHIDWSKQKNLRPSTPMSCSEFENSELAFTEENELSLGNILKTHVDRKPKLTLAPTEQTAVDKQEKNVSHNCIVEYINRCKITKAPLPSNTEKKYWDYSDFQNLQLRRDTHPENSEEQTGVKMPALDFLMSNFLLAKEDDSFSPINEHANQVLEGKKKGTLNLMDVMELQVEMGLA